VAAIRVAVLTITFEMLADVGRNFMKRVVLCAENAGLHIEDIVFTMRSLSDCETGYFLLLSVMLARPFCVFIF